MSTGLYLWSQTALSNGNADPSINWQEGQAPSSVNDSARAMMAAMAKWRDDNNGSLQTSGTGAAYTLTSNQATGGTIPNGFTIAFRPNVANTGAVTLSVDGSTAAPLRGVTGTDFAANFFNVNAIYYATYISASSTWLVHDIATSLITPSPNVIDIFAVIGDGINTISTGVAANWLELDFAGTFTQWSILANVSGSISIDLWKCTYSQFDSGATHPVAGDKISASAPITFSSATKGQSSTLTGWTTSFSAGDVLAFNVASVTTCKQVTVSLKCTKS